MNKLIIENATVLDMVSDRAQPASTIVVEDGEIVQVGKSDDFGSMSDKPGVTHIDVGGAYVMPGIADSHVHLLAAFADIYGGQDLVKLQSDANLAYRCAYNAKRALLNGITTLRVVSEARHIDIDLREAIRQGTMIGPHLFVAGQGITSTSGHGYNSPGTIEIDGPYEAAKAVRQQVKAGADLIKLMISGGIGTPGEAVDTPQFSDEELASAVSTARRVGKTVAVHAGGSKIITRAAQLGVTSVEHGYEINDRTAETMAECGTYLVPTLVVSNDEDYTYDPDRPDWWREKAQRAGEEHVRSFQRARKAGVPIVAGSDVPDFVEYIFREMELLYSLGMSGHEVLVSATRTPAEMCGLAEVAGTLQPGKRADMIVAREDPRQPKNLRDLLMVIKDGAIYRDKRKQKATEFWTHPGKEDDPCPDL